MRFFDYDYGVHMQQLTHLISASKAVVYACLLIALVFG
jgi:hypothetical protein